jgi:hypothetical protein
MDLESCDSEKASIAGVGRLPSVAFQPAIAHNRTRLNKELTRTQSVSFTPTPAVSQPENRVPVEFRTISLHVTLTRDGDADGQTARQGKASVKGKYKHALAGVGIHANGQSWPRWTGRPSRRKRRPRAWASIRRAASTRKSPPAGWLPMVPSESRMWSALASDSV